MPSLLSLPREVRDLILKFALIIDRPAPKSPWSEAIHRKDVDPEPRDNPYPLGRGNIYQSGRTCYTKFEAYVLSPMPTFLALLLSNKQLAREARYVMRKASQHDFKLDIMFINETETWPTWLWAVPMPDQHAVRRMDVSIRYYGAYSKCRFPRSGFEDEHDFLQEAGNGGPCYWVWAFYFILERFLRCGPVGGYIKDEDKQWSIGELNIDVLDTPVMHDPSLAHNRKRASWLALPIADALGWIVRNNYNVNGFTKLLYTRVGRLKVSAAGTVIKDWELGKKMKAFEKKQLAVTFPPGSHLRRKSSFQKDRISEAIRRKKMTQKRRERGLPTE